MKVVHRQTKVGMLNPTLRLPVLARAGQQPRSISLAVDLPEHPSGIELIERQEHVTVPGQVTAMFRQLI